MTLAEPSTLFGAYSPPPGVYDELVDAEGRVRSAWAPFVDSFERLGHAELLRRNVETARSLERDGVSYNVNGSSGTVRRAWSLDALPLAIDAAQWARIERGMRQRAHLLDLVLTDLYGERRFLTDSLLPPQLVLDDPAFIRACDGLRVPGARQLFNLAVDLIRDEHGAWRAMSDRADAPSGAGYAMQNRTVVSQVLPRVFRQAGVDRLAPYFRTLRQGLQSVAPAGADEPRIVVLSPGSLAETAFEHAFLASQLGYPLVEGSDLVVRAGRVWLRTVQRLRPVDVILRRVDSGFCDPLELRSDSELGVAGLLDAARRGTVTVVNPIGSGVIENAGVAARLPRLAQALLGEELELPPVASWWCGDPRDRAHVLANLHELVVRPTSRHRGSTRFGPSLSRAELDALRAEIERHPYRWVGQELVCGSTTALLGPGGLEARRTVLRAFAVASGGDYSVMNGGLTRVADDQCAFAVSNQLGAVAKDTWVLSSGPESLQGFWLDASPLHDHEPDSSTTLSGRAAENLFWLGRYAERAEAAARLLRSANARRIEFEHGGSQPGIAAMQSLCLALTRVTTAYPGFVGDDRKLDAPEEELLSLLLDIAREGSVAHAVQRLLDAADAVRDQLSIDTFLVVGALHRELTELATTPQRGEDDVQWALGRALQSLLALGGLGSESMVRDDAWRFLDTGRRLERALQIVNLVGATLGVERDGPTDSLVLESVLTAGESIITYRRRYQSRARTDTVLDLLVGAPDNPRSVRFQLDLLVSHLYNIAGDRESVALDLARESLRAVQSVSTIRLAAVDETGTRVQLVAFTDALRDLLHRVAGEVDRENFGRLLPHHAVRTPTDTTGTLSAPFDEGALW
jgi:uncharacterized circularly permuted ATP-grasp superfamily protein/uncharacterized alpha-E superfamily protein